MSIYAGPTRPDPETPAERLARLVKAKACIAYHEDLPDPEYPKVRCSIYGAPKTNELFVKIANGRLEFVAVAPSPVSFPLMADRIFGLDAEDHAVAFGLADKLWAENKTALISTLEGR